MKETLRSVPLLAGLPEDDLDRLAAMIRARDVAEGTVLFQEGDAGDRAYVIEAGEIEVTKRSGERDVLLAVRRAGEVIGEMSLVEDAPRMAGARARCDSRLLVIEREDLDRLLDTSASAARAVFDTVMARWRATGAMLRQGEKMAQLGTLTAGVAHELNNPSAAVKRGADHLAEVVAGQGERERRLGELGLAGDPRLETLVERAGEAVRSPRRIDALDRSDAEDEVETWLERRGIPEPWELAPMLVELSYQGDALEELAAGFDDDHFPAVLSWLAATFEVQSLLAEVGQGARRISEIVQGLKTYAYLDQAPVQAVDIHQGLDSTLLILRSKLKEIEVRRDYADGLPEIHGYGSELNQVWTNLIDNAVYAMDGQGTLTLRTRAKGEWVEVDIEDDGPGIPVDIRDRIFDAFFTTKPPGAGTGLGLEISYNIVANRHHGDLSFTSEPGRTAFTVRLPVNFEHADGGGPALDVLGRPDDGTLLRILKSAKSLAVVGIKDRDGAVAHDAPAAILERGYRVLPVNPTLDTALGMPTYPDLKSLPETPDVVLIFRRSEHVPAVVDEAIEIGANVVWMQEGIIHEEAAAHARAAGLDVVMDTCWRATMNRLLP